MNFFNFHNIFSYGKRWTCKNEIPPHFKRDFPLGLLVIGLTGLNMVYPDMNKNLETILQVTASVGFGVLVYDTIVLFKKIRALKRKDKS